MPVNKQHDEFYALDLESGWETPPGYPDGIQQKIISGGLDEEARSGTRTARCSPRWRVKAKSQGIVFTHHFNFTKPIIVAS